MKNQGVLNNYGLTQCPKNTVQNPCIDLGGSEEGSYSDNKEENANAIKNNNSRDIDSESEATDNYYSDSEDDDIIQDLEHNISENKWSNQFDSGSHEEKVLSHDSDVDKN